MKIAILDDYQHVTLRMTDWTSTWGADFDALLVHYIQGANLPYRMVSCLAENSVHYDIREKVIE